MTDASPSAVASPFVISTCPPRGMPSRTVRAFGSSMLCMCLCACEIYVPLAFCSRATPGSGFSKGCCRLGKEACRMVLPAYSLPPGRPPQATAYFSPLRTGATWCGPA